MCADERMGTGKMGEEIAVSFLKEAGYKIVERNYRCPLGEIDIVARDGETTVLVEVKSRRSERFGLPQAAVGPQKQRKLSMVALHYLSQRKLTNCNARFDVVAVKLLPQGHRVELIANAFDLSY